MEPDLNKIEKLADDVIKLLVAHGGSITVVGTELTKPEFELVSTYVNQAAEIIKFLLSMNDDLYVTNVLLGALLKPLGLVDYKENSFKAFITPKGNELLHRFRDGAEFQITEKPVDKSG